MISEKIDISIIIPTKNGGKLLDTVLTAVFNQKSTYSFEVIVIDSGSGNESLDIIKRYPVRLYEIASEDFSHSKTRNLGASYSRAEKYLIFINHDAVPSGKDWLNSMVKSIEYEPGLKAACATELTKNNYPFNTSGVGGYLFNNSTAEGIYVIEPNLFDKFSSLPKEKLRVLFPFTTVCVIFDKKYFEEYPFNEDVLWAEDLYWAVENSNRGCKSACSLFAKVYHYHEYDEKGCKEIEAQTNKACLNLFDTEKIWFPVQKIEVIEAMLTKIEEQGRQIEEVHNSFSWRITSPLRFVLDLFVRSGGR